ncbi:phosphatidylinositol-3-phosphate-binding ubiquitin-protein ligase [Hanseniaspora uvarum]|nr:phosphatidylinositol-3-phosphate-binding ubiquitin-protein ligase [Hanseniaspora uvarum]
MNNNDGPHPEIINKDAIWVDNNFSGSCLRCNSTFIAFFNPRHHCRICGLIYCDDCCNKFLYYDEKKIKVINSPYEEHAETGPYRTCYNCFNELSRTSILKTTPIHVEEKKSIRSAMDLCLVCGQSKSADGHGSIDDCLQKTQQDYQNKTNKNNRMLVYDISQQEIDARQQKLSDRDDDNDFECPICFELFEANEKVGRLECLCMYHYDCIKAWFKKKKEKLNNKSDGSIQISRNWCPVHDALA